MFRTRYLAVLRVTYESLQSVEATVTPRLALEEKMDTWSSIYAVPANATAYAHRDKLLKMQFYDAVVGNAGYEPAYMVFIMNEWVGAIEKASSQEQFGAYVNYADVRLARGEAHWRYWGRDNEQLLRVKDVYDLDKVFEGPQLES